jgi:hypothetical protein
VCFDFLGRVCNKNRVEKFSNLLSLGAQRSRPNALLVR